MSRSERASHGASPIAVVAGTPLGRALARRLREDGRPVIEADAADGAGLAPLRRARLVVVDATAAALPETARALGEVLDGGHLVAHTVRGLLPGGEGAMELLRAETAARRVGVIAGPLAVADLEAARPTAAVVASRHPEVVDELARALSTPSLRLYRGHDPLGVELSSALAELVVTASGLLDALGLPEASRALLVVRAVREIGRLVQALGGDPHTATGLSGLGDVLVRMRDPDCPAVRRGHALASASSGEARAELRDAILALRRLRERTRVEAHIFAGLIELVEGRVTAPDLIGQLMAVPVVDE